MMAMVRRRWVWVWIVACLMLSLVVVRSAAASVDENSQPAASAHITILHTNDMHARATEGSHGELGFAKIAGIVDAYREANPHTLFLDAGDAIHGTTFATLVGGKSVVQAMNGMSYDAMAPGNHEFNYGTDHLLALSRQLNFPIISANVRNEAGERIFDPYMMREIAGIKLGIFGLSTPETAYKSHPGNVKGIAFTDPVKEARLIVDELAPKADIIIALAHLGVDESSADTSLRVAQQVKGIDLFIDGHSHTVLEEGLETEGGTLIASTGEYTQHVGVVDLWVEQGRLVKRDAKLLNAESAAVIAPNAKVAELVAVIQKKQEHILAEEVGTAAVHLEGEREFVRAGETNLGNLIADALLHVTGADVALMNGGGIRSSIDEGVITNGEIITVLPFGNQIVTLEVKGRHMREALENGVADYPHPRGAFPQVGGMSFKIDSAGEKGNRVHDVMIGGMPLKDDAIYTLATNDFLAAGGDEYTMLGGYPQAGMFGSLDEALTAYIQHLGTASPSLEGRIAEESKPAETEPQKLAGLPIHYPADVEACSPCVSGGSVPRR
ncbi:5'-nucleotidase C-terminal domain-containing protein [Paenibacillus sp. J5C_2022]|uniref:bifunctional metallophosphatase/5'-nucleotidase n=1 Tax=Paenibacillus sp. J5C2022 TaxID=2977129 RepID=UPI0021CE2ED0|nr:5'-nucleotidase C-terminal domain-containing protein [Paenibacillus sp. J5C2022]MCU6712775.1 5'-nucleotidase C-terminal domain-containing protein [Paenibacillus sp. J5C2022]